MIVEKGPIFTFLFSLLIFTVLGCGETQDAFYKDMDAARKASAVEKGWIPNIIPKSSTEINERHNIDSNQVWIRFRFDSKDIQRLIEQVEELSPKEIQNVGFISPGSVNWWPREIDKDLFRAKGGQLGLKIYGYNRVLEYSYNRQKRILSFFIIDWDSNMAYYWQPSS